jgi:hypothetical protein
MVLRRQQTNPINSVLWQTGQNFDEKEQKLSTQKLLKNFRKEKSVICIFSPLSQSALIGAFYIYNLPSNNSLTAF